MGATGYSGSSVDFNAVAVYRLVGLPRRLQRRLRYILEVVTWNEEKASELGGRSYSSLWPLGLMAPSAVVLREQLVSNDNDNNRRASGLYFSSFRLGASVLSRYGYFGWGRQTSQFLELYWVLDKLLELNLWANSVLLFYLYWSCETIVSTTSFCFAFSFCLTLSFQEVYRLHPWVIKTLFNLVKWT